MQQIVAHPFIWIEESVANGTVTYRMIDNVALRAKILNEFRLYWWTPAIDIMLKERCIITNFKYNMDYDSGLRNIDKSHLDW